MPSSHKYSMLRKGVAESGMSSLHRYSMLRKGVVIECCAYAMQGTPFCYRFRVPPNKDIVIKDQIRGDVKFNTNALGDFVILRSNGLPVYNFCVAIDDALMRITHVIRAVRPAMRLPLASSTPVEWRRRSCSPHRAHHDHFPDAQCAFDLCSEPYHEALHTAYSTGACVHALHGTEARGQRQQAAIVCRVTQCSP